MVRILWSGITGRVGKLAIEALKDNDDVLIVAGVCRNDCNYYNYDQLDDIKEEYDVIVDFSHSDSFDRVLNYALKVRKPLIIGTGRLSDKQVAAYEEAAKIIPIFKGGNFQFEVKKFIDDVLEYAKVNDDILLVETHYKTKNIPSETAKRIFERVFNETGKTVNIESYLEYDELINDYKVADLHCRVVGFEQLAKDVLKIAEIMKEKKPNGVYTLDNLIE